MLTKEQVINIAKLSRIALTEEEVEKFQKDLSRVLDYVEELKGVNVDGLEEVNQVTGLVNVQRPDVTAVFPNLQDIYKNAPEMKDGFYKVKEIL